MSDAYDAQARQLLMQFFWLEACGETELRVFRETKDAIATALRSAVAQAREEGRRAGIEECAQWHDYIADHHRLVEDVARDNPGDLMVDALGSIAPQLAELHEVSAKGIRALAEPRPSDQSA